MYLDTPIVNEESGKEGRLGDYELHDQDGSLRSADHLDLMNAINALPERERGIVFARFFKEKTQSEIAHAFGISQMHVSRLLVKTLTILRQQLTPTGDEVLVVQATQTAVFHRQPKTTWNQASFGREPITPLTRLAVSRPSPPPPPSPKSTREELPVSPATTKYGAMRQIVLVTP